MDSAIKTFVAAAGLTLLLSGVSCTEREPAASAQANAATSRPDANVTPPPQSESSPTAGSTDPVDEVAAKKAIGERAARLWAAKKSDDWATVYNLRDPSVQRIGTEAEYVTWAEKHEPFRTHEYAIGTIFVEGGMAWVEVDCQLSTRQIPAPPRAVHRWDKWRLVKNEGWFPVPREELDAYPKSPTFRDQAEEARLRERFMASWDARMARDWVAYIELFDPADRPTMTLEKFTELNEMFIYEACDLHWVEVIGDKGRVRVAITERVTDPSLSKLPPQVAVSTEKWIKVDGAWYVDLLDSQSSVKGGT